MLVLAQKKPSCRGIATGVVALFLSLNSARALSGTMGNDLYNNSDIGVKFAVPEGWYLTKQTGFSPLLAFLSPEKIENKGLVTSRKKSSLPHLSLALAHRSPQQTLVQLGEENARAMRAVGLHVRSAGPATMLGKKIWRLSAERLTGKNPPRRILQIYLPTSSPRVFILTLSALAGQLERYTGELTYLFETLNISDMKIRAPAKAISSSADPEK